jgi:uncharacterized membrane protein (UPF0182 family)
MLRKGQLQGTKRPWGTRYVWEVSADGLDEFLAEYGRLDGRRRTRTAVAVPVTDVDVPPAGPASPELEAETAPTLTSLTDLLENTEDQEDQEPDPEPDRNRRPFILRPRGRATVMVVALGVPLLVAHVVARTLPAALWFREVDQGDVFGRTLLAQLELRVIVTVTVAAFVAANLLFACRAVPLVYRRAGRLGAVIVSFVAGAMFASAVAGDWQTYLLWRHRQSFGVTDPLHGRDVGFFVFELPFELLVSHVLLWLVAVTAVCVSIVYWSYGKLRWHGRHASFDAQQHLAVLAAAFLMVVAWRAHLQQYLLELQQPARGDTDAFAGADYVDVHVRTPALAILALLTLLLALACLAAPLTARRRGVRRARLMVGIPLALLGVGAGLVAFVLPPLAQRFVVDPNPLLREQPLLQRSIAATRHGLALDTIDVEPYTPTNSFAAADYPELVPRLRHVQTWDATLLGSRMRQLVTDTPYFSPEDQALDVVRVDGRREPTVVSARELDLEAVLDNAGTWINNRLAYTHGLGLVRFSGTDIGPDRGPRLLDSGFGVHQPRIYFGNFAGTSSLDEGAPTSPSATRIVSLAGASWVLVNTRRPEVDAASNVSSPTRPYHYTGPGGIQLSSWLRRAVFALALDSKQLLLSHDITPESRILLHRDVHDRLSALAPFIHWDANAVPLTSNGRVVFVVDGYTTSADYPYAQEFDLGGTRVGYARPSVRATVDAFSGRVRIYLTDPDDPLVSAWSSAFPSLFSPADSMPPALAPRLRYPAELFNAQASAYERFHTTDVGVFASDSDAWSRPVALAGPIEVASEVDFDESDEDDLRLTMQPAYTYSSPPGSPSPRLTLSTYYVPAQGQNLVATLSGWIDRHGRPRLSGMGLSRNPVTLGPAQVSRLVFATPRVRNLLGLRNLEIRDLDKSSLDSVILGRPHLLFLPGGVMQIQSLFEGSRGPGAARLLGVTAYINGRAGLGPDIEDAVRQALNEPPLVEVQPPQGTATVDKQVVITFQVRNARREMVTITSSAGRERVRRQVVAGRGTVTWTPTAAGRTRVHVEVLGLDGTETSDSAVFRVLAQPPMVRLLGTPGRAVVGEPLRIHFRILHGHDARATVSTRAGIVFSRRYELAGGRGVVSWTPQSPGRATIVVRARGHQRQTATVMLRVRVHPETRAPAPPPIELLHVPKHPTEGVPGRYAFRASDCHTALARISGPSDEVPRWRFPCPVSRAEFTWTPAAPGLYTLTTLARVAGGPTSSQTVQIRVAPASPEGASSP